VGSPLQRHRVAHPTGERSMTFSSPAVSCRPVIQGRTRCRYIITRATSVTVITVVRQLVVMIAKGFILPKDNYRIRTTILRDNKILRDFGPR
jgi:hypothetical protein